jgi:uncharacterized protein (DUF1778 family)
MVAQEALRVGKTSRVNLRVDAASKRALERAAAYTGSTLSDFILSNALAAASEVIRSRETIALSPKDWDAFFEALMDPPEPSERLSQALRRHDDLYG